MRGARSSRGRCAACAPLRELPAAAPAARGVECGARAAAPTLTDRLAPGERVRQRAAVDVLELAPARHAVGDAAGADAAPRGELAEEMGRRLALDRGVGGEDQLAHPTLCQDRLELAHAELLRADAIERREVPH